MEKIKAITIDDVAKLAGVSKSTVSQFLNKRYEYMSEKTRNKIEKVVEELNFQPNHFASNLKRQKTAMVGIIVANILHTLSTEIIRIIEHKLQEQGIQVIICNSDDDPQREIDHIKLLTSINVSGLIIFPTGDNYEEYNKLLNDHIPIVFIDRKIEGIFADTVLLDNESASFMAVSTLLQRGKDKIALLTQPANSKISPRIERIEGYKKALSFFKCNYSDELLCSNTLPFLKEDLSRMYQSELKPNGIIAGNDLVLRVVLGFLKENHISIPGDTAVIGIDDVAYANIHQPPLTTIAQPTSEMGIKAVEILLEYLKGTSPKVPVVYRFSPELKLRESC